LSRAKSVLREVWPLLALLVVLVGLWQLVYATKFYNPAQLPSPVQVWDSLTQHVGDGTIQSAVAHSMGRLLIGFAISVVLGTLMGVLIVGSSLAQRSVGRLMIGLQSLPSVAWLPLAYLLFGIGEQAVMFVIIVGALPSVSLATAASLNQVPPLLQRAGRTLGAKGWGLYRSVVFPAAIPNYVNGLQQGWAFAWRGLMTGEIITYGAALGLGQLLTTAQQRLDAPEVVAVMVVVVAIGMIVDLAVFGALDRHIRARRGLLLPAVT